MLFYRLLLILAFPLLILRMGWALLRGTETWSGISQRLGGGSPQRPDTDVLWLHGASLGELTAARSLIKQLCETRPNTSVLVTANTVTGQNLVASWAFERVFSQLAPLDNTLIVHRFLGHWRPKALISMENEFWPNRTILAARNAVPVVVVSGRMSEKTGAMWGRFAGLSKKTFDGVSALFPMDDANGERFVALGLDRARLGPVVNLKSSVVMGQPDPKELTFLQPYFSREHTVLAASTHPGEEQAILQAFARARKSRPELRLILAPRHASRSRDVGGLIRKAGLPFVTRSSGQDLNPDTLVYLADTTGEMALWYASATTVLLGGSWVPKGGHSPFEPAQFGALILHGPDVSNHRDAYGALHRAKAAILVDDASDLCAVLVETMDNKQARKSADRGRKALSSMNQEAVQIAPVLAKITELTA